VAAALLGRERTGRAAPVETSLLRMGTYANAGQTNRYLHAAATHARTPFRTPDPAAPASGGLGRIVDSYRRPSTADQIQ
jgi:crotonobetainyl-CoA:carnitine CoA-transferase CaiB-like acyl-CoA transferase